jgi:hypothetical protein
MGCSHYIAAKYYNTAHAQSEILTILLSIWAGHGGGGGRGQGICLKQTES